MVGPGGCFPFRTVFFLMASFFSILSNSPASGSQSEFLWKTKAPPRVLAFGWLLLCGSDLTLDNLHRRNMIIINAHPSCLQLQVGGPPFAQLYGGPKELELIP